MKQQENYRVTAVRLVEFHNLGTTTVELPDGGHLFLLGDNGSGKTTLLDAIHLVLTAGREMEFNSAARVAGAKDSGGRTYQGVVLRYNAEAGRSRRESGITYAALELRSDSGRVLSLAVGLAAEGMDIAIDRWGGIASAPVAELPLTVDEDGKIRAATAAEFKNNIKSLAGGRAYAHINEYADAVGERIFGGKEKYADVCKLLRIGKAYREIAAKAANYDELFRQLLEEPSRDVFEPLLKGLRELEDSKARLEQIDERAKYLGELDRASHRLGELRQKRDLVDWAEADRDRRRAASEIALLEQASADGAAERARTVREADEQQSDVARQRERLAELRTKDSSGLINREKEKAVQLENDRRRAKTAAGDAEEAKRISDAESKSADKARREHSACATSLGESVQKGAKAAELPMGALTDALFASANGDGKSGVDAAFDSAVNSVRVEIAGREGRLFDARRIHDEAQRDADAAEAALEKLRSQKESMPRIDGFAETRDELRGQMLSARPLYELLEPAGGCDARHVALVERLIGEDVLATWVVESKDADNVRRILWRNGGGMLSVAVRGENDASDPVSLAPWLSDVISFDESDPEAIRVVAAHLASKVGPKDVDFASVKTWTHRFRQGAFADAKPRLIGRKAREAEHARIVRAAEDDLTEAQRRLKATAKTLAERQKSLDAAKSLAQIIDDGRRDIDDSLHSCEFARLRANNARASAEDKAALAAERRREAETTAEELEDIRLKMREAGIDGSLERKIASVEKKIKQGEERISALNQELGRIEGRIKSLSSQIENRRREVEAAGAKADEAARRFAYAVADGVAAGDFVKERFPAAVAADADFAALREEMSGEARVTAAAIQAKIRDAKGEPFQFSFDEEANAIADRRGSPLAEVMADETRRLEELRTVIDRKSREVFERIFMGEVMRRLSIACMQMDDLVRRIQRKLAGRRFGMSRYAFEAKVNPEYARFVELVRRGHVLDSGDGKDELRAYLEEHREEIMGAEVDAIPDMFDYRKWFRFQLKVLLENDEGRVIDRKVKSMGSGGEQAVPNYLLILTVAEFLYHAGESATPPKAAPMLFDEAFYGIDSSRRDQLLAFAEDLGLQLFVSSPDQDGVKREIRHSVSLIVVKDENLDVHLSPVRWTNTAVQGELLGDEAAQPGMTLMEETK